MEENRTAVPFSLALIVEARQFKTGFSFHGESESNLDFVVVRRREEKTCEIVNYV